MRILAVCFGLACLFVLPLAAAAQAPTIDLQWDPRIPDHVENPGGLFSAVCIVDPGDAEGGRLRLSLIGPNGDIIWTGAFPGQLEYEYEYIVPEGAEDGIYTYEAEFESDGRPPVIAQGRILVAGALTGLCVVKYYDENGNGIYDEEEVLSDWEMCYDGPSGVDCELTDDAGTACWFGIEPGLYTVCETLQDGYVCTTCDDCCCMTIDVLEDDINKILIGNDDAPVPVIETSWGRIKSNHREE